jgi:hypothetical protein
MPSRTGTYVEAGVAECLRFDVFVPESTHGNACGFGWKPVSRHITGAFGHFNFIVKPRIIGAISWMASLFQSG